MRWGVLKGAATCMPLLEAHVLRQSRQVCRQVKSYSKFNLFGKKSPETLAHSDGLDPSKEQLVYNSGLDNYLLLASCTSTGLGVGSIAAAAALWKQGSRGVQQTETEFLIGSFENFFQVMTGCSFLAFFALSSMYIVTHVPVRIYYRQSEQLFQLVFHQVIPGLQKIKTFSPGAFIPLPGRRDSVAMQLLGNVAVRGTRKRFMVLEHRFKTLAYYNVLMGYDSADILQEENNQWSASYTQHDD